MNNYFGNKRGFVKNYMSGFIRACVTALLVIFQFGCIILLSLALTSSTAFIYYVIQFVSVFTIIGLVNNKTNPSFKISWLVIISLLPIAGFIMYIMWGRERSTKKLRAQIIKRMEYGTRFIKNDDEVYKDFLWKNSEHERLANYMISEGFPLYRADSLEYYPMGEDTFKAILEELEKAKHFILIEFFIVAEGVLWERTKVILKRKAAEGIEIKFLYDDFGSLFRTDKSFWKELTDAGIEVATFNPIHKYLAKLYMNYRSHQKIIVIDGNIGFTGGMNLADEYVNEVERFGTWKDNAVRVTGSAVFGLTTTFLQMWGVATNKNVKDYDIYKPELKTVKGDIFCNIISDGPANNPSNPIVAIYRQIIYSARKFLYITTPYLVLEDDIANALAEAAKGGVDVRIITPAVPDKKTVFQLTRYNYGRLMAAGVRIYEYTPGFIHAKTIITEDYGVVGTINLDYRSLYLHYECGAFMWNRAIIDKIREDLLDTMQISCEMSYKKWLNRPKHIKIIQRVLNLFSSLM